MIASVLVMLSGCTLGPVEETRYVIVHAGQPIRILTNESATGERLDGAGVASFDIGGWVAMPPDHWETIKTILEAKGMSTEKVKP